MAILKRFVTCAAIVSLALAQSNNTALQIEAIQAHFSNAQLVPVPIPAFNPTAVLTVNFNGVGNISPGQLLTEAQVKTAPILTLTPANSTIILDGNYTLAMVDPGAVGSNQSGGQTRHWLVNAATVSNGNVSINSGTQITSYAGPAPPPGSGVHRYTIVLYSQPNTFHPPSNLSTAGVPVSTFDFPAYVQSTGLGPAVAGMYFTVEVGTASSSAPATSPVITSTLPVPSSTYTSTGSSPSGSSGSKSGGSVTKTITLGSLIGITALTSYIIL